MTSSAIDPDEEEQTTANHPALDYEFEDVSGRGAVDKVVFGITAVVSLAFIAWGLIGTASLSSASGSALSWVVSNLAWLFATVATGFVVFCLWLAVSRYGRIPLGRVDEEPEFRTVSWIAMMFSAGMGIGLMFFGAAEPLSHFITPPPGTGPAGNPDALRNAMATSYFHWSLHPWAIYAVAGLAIAYSVYRKGRSFQISSVFEPLLGKRRSEGVAGQVIDMLAIFATLFGSATSLGLGALQIASGWSIVGLASGDASTNQPLLVGIITVLTICFVVSAVSGVSRGIQWLSNTNMVLALILAVFVFVLGPTVLILNLIPTTLGTYIQELPRMAGRTEADGGAATQEWLAGWTIFYWAWWISWTPFVSMFIARISRGRTIQQFVAGVLLVPSAVALIWFAIFGGTAISQQEKGADVVGDGNSESVLFTVLDQLTTSGVVSTIASVLVIVLVSIFFVSGADAASLVMGSLSERGKIKPSRAIVIFWGAATGAVAAVMLLVGGKEALTGLQQITIIASVPFVLVMIGMGVSLMKELYNDPLIVRQRYGAAAVEHAVLAGVTSHGDAFALTIDQAPDGEGVGDLVNRHNGHGDEEKHDPDGAPEEQPGA